MPNSQITKLDLGKNKIGKAGAEALAIALPRSQITELNLQKNKIEDAGAQALADALPSSRVAKLYLRGKKKYEEACTELILKLQTESPTCEEQLSLICRGYKTIMREGGLEQPEVRLLRQNFLKLLKQFLPTHLLSVNWSMKLMP